MNKTIKLIPLVILIVSTFIIPVKGMLIQTNPFLEERLTLDLLTSMLDWSHPRAQIERWRDMMPKQPSKGDQTRIMLDLPPSWMKHQVNDPRAAQTFTERILPVNKRFGKDYKIILLEFNKPVMLIDNDSVLIITTELVKIIKNDDELFGLIVHEMAHSIFREKSSLIKNELATSRKQEAIGTLSLIELMCDAIAAFTLEEMNRDPTSFLSLIARSEESYEVDKSEDNYHPTGKQRLKIISQLIPARTSQRSK